jgi:hypothetical protein
MSLGDINGRRRTNWRLLIYGASGAVLVFLPEMTFGSDIGSFMLSLVIAAFIGLLLLIFAIRDFSRNALSVFLMFVVCCSVSVLLFKTSDTIHTTGRWFLHSRIYKGEVLAQPNDPQTNLKHVTWEQWGFAGVGDTDAYLVYDPDDHLSVSKSRQRHRERNELPCEVDRIHRLEKNWYIVRFYMDTDWDHCPPANGIN